MHELLTMQLLSLYTYGISHADKTQRVFNSTVNRSCMYQSQFFRDKTLENPDNTESIDRDSE